MPDISLGLSFLRLLTNLWRKILFAIKQPRSAIRHIQSTKWWGLSWDFRGPLGMLKRSREPIYVSCLQAFCENKSREPVHNISGHIISNITSKKLPLTMEGMAPEEAAGIPAECKFFIQVLFRDPKSEREGIVEEKFMEEWSDFTFVFVADEKQYRFHFGKKEIINIINQFKNDAIPKAESKITRKVENNS